MGDLHRLPPRNLPPAPETISVPETWAALRAAARITHGTLGDIVGLLDTEAPPADIFARVDLLNTQLEACDRVAPRTTLGDDFGGTVAGAIGGPQGWALAQAGRIARAGINAAGQAADVARNRQLADAVTLTQGERLDAILAALDARGATQRRAAALGDLAARGGQAALLSQADRARPYLPTAFPALPAFSR